MQKRNETHGRSMPKPPVWNNQRFPQPGTLPHLMETVHTQNTGRKPEEVNVETMDMVNFLYPIYPPSRRRYPLTRCLLGYLIEFIKSEKKEEDHNFRTVIDIISNLLNDINDKSIEGKDKLDSLEKTFIDEDGCCLDERFRNMYELFYHYDKMDSQQYTVAGLLYDLIPLVNVTFKEVESAIKNRKSLNDIIEHKKKSAMYQDNKPLLIFYKIREISERLFTQAEPIRQSIMQIALLQSMEKRGSLDLNFDVEQVRLYLMRVYLGNETMIEPDIQCDNELTQTIGWLFQIAESASSLRNMILYVSERILMAEGNVEEIFGKHSEFVSTKDDFFF